VGCLANMTRRKCTKSLRKFGFCAILAVVYAVRLPMPASKNAFYRLLMDISSIIGKPSSQWAGCASKNIGTLSVGNMLRVLLHYHCSVVLHEFSGNSNDIPTLDTWLAGISSYKRYIFIVNDHAMFVETKAIPGIWKLYDQHGIQTNQQMHAQREKNGYGICVMQCVVELC